MNEQALRNVFTSGTRDFHLFTPVVSLGGTEWTLDTRKCLPNWYWMNHRLVEMFTQMVVGIFIYLPQRFPQAVNEPLFTPLARGEWTYTGIFLSTCRWSSESTQQALVEDSVFGHNQFVILCSRYRTDVIISRWHSRHSWGNHQYISLCNPCPHLLVSIALV